MIYPDRPLPIEDPYMVKVARNGEYNYFAFRKITKLAQQINSTVVAYTTTHDVVNPPDMTPQSYLYIAFEQEEDAVAFILSVNDANAARVHIWPSRMKFTVCCRDK